MALRSHVPQHERTALVFSGLLLALFMAALDGTIVATALPTIVSDLGGLAHISWVVTAYLLAQTIVTPLYGKLGDLYGRKGVLQAAVMLFLLGSALCGLSRSMTELILFRALQGLGGGGLIVTTQAIVGDIVAPRDRGRYQGIFGAVFALSSVAGPLIGGYFTSYVSWRWIFYINVPIGALALVIVALALSARLERDRRIIDYTGAALLAAILSGLVIGCDLAPSLGWTSPSMIALTGVLAICVVLFVVIERRAAEPVLPLKLFGNRVFIITSAIALVVGVALFGSVTYMPLFLQIVKESSPTASGLEMTPMMGGVVLTSVIVGHLISRIGRYKIFPLSGTAVMTFALFLLSRVSPESSTLSISLMMLLLGLGLGMVMQVLVIAVQNAVDYADLGVATSGAILFRLIGGAIGTAVLGGIFNASLEQNLTRFISGGDRAQLYGTGMSPEALARLAPELRHAYVQAFTDALNTTFLATAAVALVGFVLSWLLRELPLRKTVAAATADDVGNSAGHALAMPGDPDSMSLLVRSLVRLADRDVQRRYIAAVVARAGVDLEPLEAWLLVRIEENSMLHLRKLAGDYNIEHNRLQAALEALTRRGLVQAASVDGDAQRYKITAAGCAVFSSLIKARRDHLAEMSSDWSDQERERITQLLAELARHLVPEIREEART
jgi:EmrB/QacA subfamily drug resistance transporter